MHASLLTGFGVLWLATAVAPSDRSAWALEHAIVVVLVILVLVGYRRWRFSDASYVSITAFLILHTLGAWTTYEQFPPGRWVQDWLGLARNPYDRVVHFAFGLLMSPPCRELLRHYVQVSVEWARRLAVPFVLSVGTVFELMESWTARIVAPELGAAFLAIQGDEWDAQKDITMAMLGALVFWASDTWWRGSVELRGRVRGGVGALSSAIGLRWFG